MTSRLASVDHELAERILDADPAACRRVAAAAAGWAVRSAGLDDPRVAVFLTRDAAPTTDVALTREAVRALVDELDEAGWDLQGQIVEGTASDRDYLRAFGKARAASAVYEATGEDPHLAALEAVYEAWVVVDDPGEIRSIIIAALDRQEYRQRSGDESGDEPTDRTASVG
jgi:hypothetical protein